MKKLISLTCACLLAAACWLPAVAEDAQRSPTTGLPTDRPYRPVLAQIDNSDQARPQWNLSGADIIYEMIIWGSGYTRYLALYNDSHPDEIGPIRGGRVYTAELQLAYGAPLVTVGGQSTAGSDMFAFQTAHGLSLDMRFDLIQNKAGFARFYTERDDRDHPFRRSFALRDAVEAAWPAADDGQPLAPQAPLLTFSDDHTTGERAVDSLRVVYNAGSYVADFAYNGETGLYERSYMGSPQIDDATGEQLTAANVIVHCAPMSYNEGNAARPLMETTGSGPCHVFIGGSVIEGRWQRLAMDAPFAYLVDGKPLVLRPGKTFIQMVTPEMYYVEDGDAQAEFVYTLSAQ